LHEESKGLADIFHDIKNKLDVPDYFVEVELLPSGKKYKSNIAWNQKAPKINFEVGIFISKSFAITFSFRDIYNFISV
jgi:hypothetical protein